jgi:hypothetical protein
MPVIDKEKYLIIGLTYNNVDSKTLYNNIKNNDTEDDWTYYVSDEYLKDKVDIFIERNKYYDSKFIEYNIKTYDVSEDRNIVINKIILGGEYEKENNYNFIMFITIIWYECKSRGIN